MNATRTFTPPAILAVEIEQFENAVEMTRECRYVNVNFQDDYYFGSIFNSGVNTLLATHSEVGKGFTVLDVGYGNGTFLREVAARYPSAHKIGMAAVSRDEFNDAVIITGDIARADTWESSAGTLPEPGSVDVAVSHLTFMHLANPINGLANVLRLIKPSGRLYIDHLRLSADPADFDVLENTLHEVLAGHVKYPNISFKDYAGQGEVALDFPVFTEGLDSVNLDVFKPYVNERGEVCFTI